MDLFGDIFQTARLICTTSGPNRFYPASYFLLYKIITNNTENLNSSVFPLTPNTVSVLSSPPPFPPPPRTYVPSFEGHGYGFGKESGSSEWNANNYASCILRPYCILPVLLTTVLFRDLHCLSVARAERNHTCQ